MIDLSPVWVSLKLASITTLLSLIITLPLAWWLTQCHRRVQGLVSATATLPLVLPPSVLGFYLLLLLGANGPLSSLAPLFGLKSFAFSFSGLVLASIIYSLPFSLLPIQNSFASISKEALEAAATLGASPLDRFTSIALPLAKPGIFSAAILCFAHTIGEFGVILMIGGSIPGETKVLSIAIYEHVESLEYKQAHILAGGMLLFSFITLLLIYLFNGGTRNTLGNSKS